MKADFNEINSSYDKLKKNADAVGLDELEKGKYQKAWNKAKQDYRSKLKDYAYADYCNGVVSVLESEAIEDASQIALLASLKSFATGKFTFEQIVGIMKEQYKALLAKRIKELERMSEELNSPIFVEKLN